MYKPGKGGTYTNISKNVYQSVACDSHGRCAVFVWGSGLLTEQLRPDTRTSSGQCHTNMLEITYFRRGSITNGFQDFATALKMCAKQASNNNAAGLILYGYAPMAKQVVSEPGEFVDATYDADIAVKAGRVKMSKEVGEKRETKALVDAALTLNADRDGWEPAIVAAALGMAYAVRNQMLPEPFYGALHAAASPLPLTRP